MGGEAAQVIGGAGEREFAFTAADFERVRRLVYEHAGISLSDMKRDLVYGRLARRLRTHGDVSFTQYLERLEGGDEEEWEAFINSLTTNLTAFFREAHHFEMLREHFATRRANDAIRIWSCACSSGEEPYSIAMTLVEHFGSFDIEARILASDLDTQVLATASAGRYPLERLAKMPEDRRRSFFLKGRGKNDGHALVRQELRRLVMFRQVNLLDPRWPLRGPLDAIFCRNAMIYFDRETQRRLLERFRPLLREGGLLFVGHSESLHHAGDLFHNLGRTVYVRVP